MLSSTGQARWFRAAFAAMLLALLVPGTGAGRRLWHALRYRHTWSGRQTREVYGHPATLNESEIHALQEGVLHPEGDGRFDASNALLAQAADAQRVVVLGDSIVQFWPDRGRIFADPHFVNRGISGQTTLQMLARVERDAVRTRPAVLVLLAGTNDLLGVSGVHSLQWSADHVRAIVDVARAHGIAVVLCTVPPIDAAWLPAQDRKEVSDAVAGWNTWLRQYSAEQGIALADTYAALTSANGTVMAGVLLDGVHPSAAGYARMEPAIGRALAEARAQRALATTISR